MANEKYDVEIVSLVGKTIWMLRCPQCKNLGAIDDDQLHGRASIQCQTPGCSFHKTINLTRPENRILDNDRSVSNG